MYWLFFSAGIELSKSAASGCWRTNRIIDMNMMLCSFAELPSELLATPSLLGNSIIATTIYADFLFPYMTATRQTGREAAGTTPLVLAADLGFRVIEAKQKGSERAGLTSSHCIADRKVEERDPRRQNHACILSNSDCQNSKTSSCCCHVCECSIHE